MQAEAALQTPFLSWVDLKDLPALPFIDKRLLPNKAAVYFVIRAGGEILYIGATVRLKQRWEAHLKGRQAQAMGATMIAWMLVPEALLDQVETLMIRHYRPALNVRRNPGRPRGSKNRKDTQPPGPEPGA